MDQITEIAKEMALFTFSMSSEHRKIATEIEPDFRHLENGGLPLARVLTGKFAVCTNADSTIAMRHEGYTINAPLEAVLSFSDHIQRAGRQSKPLDLSLDGQKIMTNAYKTHTIWRQFLNDHTM